MTYHSILATLTFALLLGVPVMQVRAQDTEAYANQTEEYLAITAVGKAFSTKWKVEVDFGQAFQWSIRNKDLLRDDDGQVIAFDSPVDALNYMNSRGWVLVNAASDQDYFYAIMKRLR